MGHPISESANFLLKSVYMYIILIELQMQSHFVQKFSPQGGPDQMTLFEMVATQIFLEILG